MLGRADEGDEEEIGEARRSWERRRVRMKKRKRTGRGMDRDFDFIFWGCCEKDVGVVEGANRSERMPVAMRATVELRATMLTCVAGVFSPGIGPANDG